LTTPSPQHVTIMRLPLLISLLLASRGAPTSSKPKACDNDVDDSAACAHDDEVDG